MGEGIVGQDVSVSFLWWQWAIVGLGAVASLISQFSIVRIKNSIIENLKIQLEEAKAHSAQDLYGEILSYKNLTIEAHTNLEKANASLDSVREDNEKLQDEIFKLQEKVKDAPLVLEGKIGVGAFLTDLELSASTLFSTSNLILGEADLALGVLSDTSSLFIDQLEFNKPYVDDLIISAGTKAIEAVVRTSEVLPKNDDEKDNSNESQ